uniref:hypothetical protein n=1 Tax=uncultured Erythrobacter sp. TaxID=263913 RepID=UPI00260BE6BD|nr:hypothetical protein [uncultured Erythrobacter sp.]
MILRRITKHVREQNWIAIAIDFVIVVVGVFLGIQLGDWNSERTDRAKERAYLERLEADVDRTREQLAVFVREREERLQSIAKVENMYLGDGEIGPLTELECTQFSGMHMLTLPPIAVPSITEAFAGGGVDLLSDPDLVQAMIEIEQNEDRLRTVIASLRLYSTDMNKKYPDAIVMVRAKEDDEREFDGVFENDGYDMAARCDFLKQAPEPAFISDTVRGTQYNQWYVSFLNRHLDRLDEVAAMLDGEETPDIGDASEEGAAQ